MSYARFSENSDVYVFLNVGGYLDCCGCSLAEYKMEKREWLGKTQEMPTIQKPYPQFQTVDEMLDHLEEHKNAGDTVPDSCISALKAEREEIEKFTLEHKWSPDD